MVNFKSLTGSHFRDVAPSLKPTTVRQATVNSSKALIKLTKKVNKIARLDKPEPNKWDVVEGTTDMSSTGTVTSTYCPGTRGDAIGEFEKNEVKPLSLSIRGHVYSNHTIAVRCRHIWFQGKHENSANPGVSDILQSANVNSHYNWDTRMHWIILSDKTYNINAEGAGTAVSRFVSINQKLFPKRKIKYATGSSSIEDGGLYLLTISDTAAGATDPSYRQYVRLVYMD